MSSPPVPSSYNGSLDTRFSRETTRVMSWRDGERNLHPLLSLALSLSCCLSYPLLSFLGLEAYCLIEILRHTGTLDFHRGTCARCVLSLPRCNGHSLLFSSYLSRIGRIENSSCSACGHSSQDTSHLILQCPATDSLRCSLFGDSLSLYDLWSKPWGVARLLEHHGLSPCPHLSEGVGQQQQLVMSTTH